MSAKPNVVRLAVTHAKPTPVAVGVYDDVMAGLAFTIHPTTAVNVNTDYVGPPARDPDMIGDTIELAASVGTMIGKLAQDNDAAASVTTARRFSLVRNPVNGQWAVCIAFMNVDADVARPEVINVMRLQNLVMYGRHFLNSLYAAVTMRYATRDEMYATHGTAITVVVLAVRGLACFVTDVHALTLDALVARGGLDSFGPTAILVDVRLLALCFGMFAEIHDALPSPMHEAQITRVGEQGRTPPATMTYHGVSANQPIPLARLSVISPTTLTREEAQLLRDYSTVSWVCYPATVAAAAAAAFEPEPLNSMLSTDTIVDDANSRHGAAATVTAAKATKPRARAPAKAAKAAEVAPTASKKRGRKPEAVTVSVVVAENDSQSSGDGGGDNDDDDSGGPAEKQARTNGGGAAVAAKPARSRGKAASQFGTGTPVSDAVDAAAMGRLLRVCAFDTTSTAWRALMAARTKRYETAVATAMAGGGQVHADDVFRAKTAQQLHEYFGGDTLDACTDPETQHTVLALLHGALAPRPDIHLTPLLDRQTRRVRGCMPDAGADVVPPLAISINATSESVADTLHEAMTLPGLSAAFKPKRGSELAKLLAAPSATIVQTIGEHLSAAPEFKRRWFAAVAVFCSIFGIGARAPVAPAAVIDDDY
jgi:hypothetical protein